MSGGGLVVGRYPSLGCQGGGGVVVANWGFKGWYPPFLLLLSEKKSGGIPLTDTDCCAYSAQSIPAEPS